MKIELRNTVKRIYQSIKCLKSILLTIKQSNDLLQPFILYILLSIPTLVVNYRSTTLYTGLLKTYVSGEDPKYRKNNNTYELH
jgi:hypothetical protein